MECQITGQTADLFFTTIYYLLIDTFLVTVLFPTRMFTKYKPLFKLEASN